MNVYDSIKWYHNHGSVSDLPRQKNKIAIKQILIQTAVMTLFSYNAYEDIIFKAFFLFYNLNIFSTVNI